MLKKTGRIRVQPAIVPSSGPGNRSARKVQRPAQLIDHYLDATGIIQPFPLSDRRRESSHLCLRMFLENGYCQIDGVSRKLGFVALKIYYQVVFDELGGNFRNPIGSADMMGISQLESAAKSLDFVHNFRIVCGDDYGIGKLAGAGRFIGMLK